MKMNGSLPFAQEGAGDNEIICIIPTLNEAITVAEVVKKAKKFTRRVVVVDGHSGDNTCEIASEAGADVMLQEGSGKGMALRSAFDRIVEGNVFVIIDGDATYDALEMEMITKPILEDEADMVIGSRLRGKMEKGSISRLNYIGNGVFNFLINSLFHGDVTDSQSGFRALSRKAVQTLDLSSEGFEVEIEMTVKALKKGLRVREVPISYMRRRGSSSKLDPFRDGLRIMKTIIKLRLERSKSARDFTGLALATC
jgi:dolichol-phosphate mannosyltransferase